MNKLLKSEKGDAVVEATILFPIMIMIFAALVLLAVFLPTHATLQRATQFAATALANEESDTWLRFDEDTLSFSWETDKSNLRNVYSELFENEDIGARGEKITRSVDAKSISSKEGTLVVNAYIENRIIYKEVVVNATREYKMPVDLSFIGFPKTIIIRASSSAMAQNPSEFIRNIDMASDFKKYIFEKFKTKDVKDAISTNGSKTAPLLGWGK